MRVRALLLAGLVVLLTAAPAFADTWNVIGTGDGGTCNPDLHTCQSLRAAIAASEATKDIPDTINVPAGTININNDLVIQSDITVIGASARTTIIDGADKYRGFRVTSTGSAKISHLTINNAAAGQGGSPDGGGIVNLSGVVQLDYVRVTGSRAATGGSGGGIANIEGTMTMLHSLVDNNVAASGTGGGIVNWGGVESPDRALLGVADSTIFNNSATSASGAGGIDSRGGQLNVLLILRSTIADNDGGVRGAGGVYATSGAWQAISNIFLRNLIGAATSNCDGTVAATLGGANVENDKECNFEFQGANPQLATALTNQGGESNVLTIGASSMARDLIVPGTNCGSTLIDQRGTTRPQGAGCDSGAYEIDVAPTVTITTGPSGTVATPDVQFQFSSTEPGVDYQCQLVGPGQSAGFVDCASPRDYLGLANGAYTFSVRAMDGVFTNPPVTTRAFTVAALDTTITGGPPNPTNNTTPTFSFTGVNGAAGFQCRFDTAAFAGCTSPFTPSVALSQGTHTFQVRALSASGAPDPTPASQTFVVDSVAPDTTILTGPSGSVSSTSATFTFSSTESPATFQCSLDGGGFSSCPASYTGLAQGSHTFSVRATDAASNTDATPATRTWIVDTVAPDTLITAGPNGPTSSTTATFTFNSTESPATFQCSLDGAAFGSCPVSYTGLAQGSHTFSVRSTDTAGNTDATPATRTWTVDTIAPDTTILTGPTGSVSSTSATFTFSSTETPVTFQCSLDGAAFGSCPAGYTGLSQGAHTFQVRSIDAANNIDASPATQTWTVDTVAPNTTILTGPTGPTGSTSATFTFSSTETPSTFQCSLDGAAFSSCPAGYTGLAQGAHTFQVRATDAAGNQDATPASQSWTVDTIAPDTSILTGPSGPTGSTSATFTFNSTETPVTFQCSLDGAAFGSCPAGYTGLSQGAHTFQVRSIDAANNIDASPATQTWTVDTVAPNTTILTGPTGPTGSTSATFTFSSTETPSTFQCSLDGAAFSSCPAGYTGLSQGSHTFAVRATDAAGNQDATPDTRSWTVDTVAPDTTITSGPTGSVSSTSATFAFTSTETPPDFQCSLDGAAFSSCPAGYTGLSQGSHTFTVRAVDAAGNQDATPATRTWTVDTIAPDTTILTGPTGSVSSTSATFTFSSTETPPDFQCSLDGAAFSSCPAGYTGLSQGSHTFTVRAVDAAGNQDATPATRTWTVDTIAPDTTILTGPTGSVSSTSATFTFTSTETPSTFQCAIDGSGFGTCPASYTGLSQGAHTFSVRSTDAAGNQDATPATRTWTVDTVAPNTSITSGPSGSVSSTTATFTFSSTEEPSTFQCAIDGGAFGACPVSYTGLAQGAHTFQVRAVDAAGNQDASPATQTWTVDTIAPDTTILTGPTGSVSSTSATFTFSSTETPPAFQCSLDGAAFGTCPAGYTGLSQGAHTFQVRAVDAAGNQDATPATRTWTVDTIAPDTTILTGPTGSVSSTSATFTFSSTETPPDFQCSLDGAAFSSCPAGYTGLSQGSHTFTVRAVDAAGNQDATPATRTWTVDTIAPDTTILTGPTGSVSSTSATFTFSSTETPPDFQCSLDGAAFSSCPAGYTGLSQGSHTFTVRAVDAAGNQDATPATRTWTVDTIAPDTSILTGPTGSVSSTSATFTFSSTETPPAFQCQLDGASFVTCPAGYTGLSQGSHTLNVRAVDAAGNQDATPATRTWTVDTIAPDTTILTGPSGSVSSTSATFTFSSTETPATFQCQLDGGGFGSCPASYTGLAQGSHTFQVRSTDAANNTDATPATRTWTVDTIAPDTTILTGPTGSVSSTSATFTFTSTETPSTFQCAIDGSGFGTCPASYTGLSQGAHTFSVRSTDAAGNQDQTPATRTWTVDTIAPDTSILTGPTGSVSSTSATFTFNSTEDPSTFQCQLDGSGFGACPVSYTGLAQGSHTFAVRATDAAGNQDATPATRTWTVDTIAPDTTILTGPTGSVSSTSATFTFNSTETPPAFQCQLDGASFVTCPAGYTGLSQGSHTLNVRAVDAAGNQDATPATRTWTVDTVAPEPPAVTVPTAGALLKTPDIAFSGTAEPGSTVRVAEGALSQTTTTTAGGTWTLTVDDVPDGARTFSATATDAAGNVSTATSRSFTVDAAAPNTTISAGPSDPTNDTTPTFEFTSNEAGSTFRCRVDAGAFADCTSPHTTAELAEGPHVFQVMAIDPAGNPDPTPETSNFTVDVTAPPAPAVEGGPSGVTSDSSPSFVFSGSPGTFFACRLDGPRGPGSFGPCTSPASFSALDPGDYTFFIRATDPAGNQTTTSRSFTVASLQQAQPTPTATPPAPAPVPGKTVVGKVTRGTVLVKLKGKRTFAPLDPANGIPLGSEVDTRKGAVQLTAQGKAGAPLDVATFFDGLFVVVQSGGITELRLSEKLAPCKKASAAAAKPKSRRLWGDGKGKFRTKGQYSAATVRGTKWLTQDTCAGTLTRVTQGVVAVKDLVTKKTVLVKKGKRYTAKPKKRK